MTSCFTTFINEKFIRYPIPYPKDPNTMIPFLQIMAYNITIIIVVSLNLQNLFNLMIPFFSMTPLPVPNDPLIWCVTWTPCFCTKIFSGSCAHCPVFVTCCCSPNLQMLVFQEWTTGDHHTNQWWRCVWAGCLHVHVANLVNLCSGVCWLSISTD